MDVEPEAFQSIIDEHHAQVGIRILRKWGYPKAFARLIPHHRAAVEADPPAAMQALDQADLLATVAGFGYDLADTRETSDRLELLGYPKQLQGGLKVQVISREEQLRYKFG